MALATCLLATILLTELVSRPASAQVFVSSNGSFAGQLSTPPNLSPSCAATFSQTVVCDPMLWQTAQGFSPNTTDLELMCNTACTTSLQALRESQVANCTASDTITVGYKVYPATYVTDLLLFTYGYACSTEFTGAWCLPQFQFYNSDSNPWPLDLCLICNLNVWLAILNSPLGYSSVLAANYSALTSSCSVSSYPVTSPTPYALGTTTISKPTTTTPKGTTPTYSCESTYTVQKTDTCVSISQSKQVSTFYLLYANKLPSFCSDFPEAGTEICIPQTCNTYTVAPWDTCESLVNSTGLTTAELIAFNPNLNAQCGNLPSMAGYVICLSAPGTVTTTVTSAPTTTSFFANPCLNPGAPSSCFVTSIQTTDDTPWPTITVNVSAASTTGSTASLPAWTDPASLPLPSGTRTDCTRYDTYVDVPANATWIDCCNPNYCFAMADAWGINGTQLMQWNPSLSYNVSDDSTWTSCLFKSGYRYCVAI